MQGTESISPYTESATAFPGDQSVLDRVCTEKTANNTEQALLTKWGQEAS